MSKRKAIHVAPPDLAEQLRAAIRADGRTIYEIAKVASVDESGLRKFMDGGDMRLVKAGKVIGAIGAKIAWPKTSTD